jgi:hypothetical protein
MNKLNTFLLFLNAICIAAIVHRFFFLYFGMGLLGFVFAIIAGIMVAVPGYLLLYFFVFEKDR